jgi:hypothetical protein
MDPRVREDDGEGGDSTYFNSVILANAGIHLDNI